MTVYAVFFLSLDVNVVVREQSSREQFIDLKHEINSLVDKINLQIIFMEKQHVMIVNCM